MIIIMIMIIIIIITVLLCSSVHNTEFSLQFIHNTVFLPQGPGPKP